jgi:4-aminobutyrate aminotransferase-like enzyme
MWGIEHDGLAPDVMTVAKGIANGHPVSAVLAREPIAAAWTSGNIATFGGNPIACAAAIATIDVIEAEKLVDNAAAMGNVLRQGLDALKAKCTAIGDVRGRGLMQGVELVIDEKAGNRAPNPDAALRVLEETRKRGLLLGRGGLYGNVLRVAPPLIVSRTEIETALKILDESLAALTS